jgi:hypothetical protein
MHDLNTINRLNAEAFGNAIKNFQAQGRWVIAKRAGLHLISIESFSFETEAQNALADKTTKLEASESVELLPPTAGFHATGRDQSEDRPTPLTLEELAALGRTGEKTLGDYVARVQADEAIGEIKSA